MNFKLFPNSLNMAFKEIFRWASAVFYLVLFIVFYICLFSFDIGDSSFYSISSNSPNNYLGAFGANLSIFLIYCYGSLSLAIPLFFLFGFLHSLKDSILNFIFLRFFVFLISLTLIEQLFIYYDYNLFTFDPSFSWGMIGLSLSKILDNQYASLFAFIIGSILFLTSINLLAVVKLTKYINIKNINFLKNKAQPKINIKKSEPSVTKKPKSHELSNVTTTTRTNMSKYLKPSIEILSIQKASSKDKISESGLKDDAKFLEGIFTDFNIQIEVVNIRVGPVVTLYEILPAPGIKINSIINLADDISRSMGATSVRIAQVYGTKFIGVEIPNKIREMVAIRELIASSEFLKNNFKIPICIGKDITGITEVIDLSKTPHLLVAGTTGSGKSVFINSLLTSMLYKFEPSELRLILIDPKMIELSVYNDIPHLLTPVVTEPKKSIIALKWVCSEMERRYQLMNEEGCRSIENFNAEMDDKMPFIVVVIDEMADLMMTAGKEVEHYVQRLAQKARACGIHLVMATQRPSVDIITGSIKANFPSRISFQVASKYDSRTILGEVGAEQLLGNGDMLMMKNGSGIIRYQSAFMSDKEVQKMIAEIKSNHNTQYVEEIGRILETDGIEEASSNLSDDDEALVTRSIDLIKNSGRASTSYLQRNFQIGYNKAARIMEVLEERGVVSKPNHTGKREILITN